MSVRLTNYFLRYSVDERYDMSALAFFKDSLKIFHSSNCKSIMLLNEQKHLIVKKTPIGTTDAPLSII